MREMKITVVDVVFLSLFTTWSSRVDHAHNSAHCGLNDFVNSERVCVCMRVHMCMHIKWRVYTDTIVARVGQVCLLHVHQ